MKNTVRLLAAAALGLPVLSFAGPSDYLKTPAVEYGEKELELRFGSAKLRDAQGGDRESAGELSLGYGITQRWLSELGLKFEKNPGERTKYDAVEWENIFQLTEPNQYFVDLGLLVELEIPRERAEGYELSFGPLFQFDTGPVRWNANLVFEKVLRSKEEGEHPLEMGYQLQARYPVAERFDVGFQAFGDMGKWNHWEPKDEQNHRIGPAIFGKVKLGGHEAIKYNAAWLFGASDGAPKNTFRAQAEYEF